VYIHRCIYPLIIATTLLMDATAVAQPSRAEHSPQLTVSLLMVDTAARGSELHRAAVREAASLWEPNRIAVTEEPSDAACVTVLIERNQLSDDVRSTRLLTLGHIRFTKSGTPEPTIMVSLPAVIELLSRSAPLRAGGQRLDEHTVWRAVGRVIAHELGHFILRFPAHSSDGLLSEQHSPEGFAADDRRPFQLSSSLRPRLLEILRNAADMCSHAR
jgi:hypothetical protein